MVTVSKRPLTIAISLANFAASAVIKLIANAEAPPKAIIPAWVVLIAELSCPVVLIPAAVKFANPDCTAAIPGHVMLDIAITKSSFCCEPATPAEPGLVA